MNIFKEITKLSRRWLDPKYRFRREAVRVLRKESGFPEKMSGVILDQIFRKNTEQGLRRLDRAMKKSVYPRRGVWGCVTPGNVPDPIVSAAVMAWTAKSALILKLSRRHRVLGELMVKAFRAESPALGRSLEVTASAERFFEQSRNYDLVMVYGSDETVTSIEVRLKGAAQFIGHGHRISAGVIFAKAMSDEKLRTWALRAAWDVWLYDQRGCLSPQVYYVIDKERANESANHFATALQGELDRLWRECSIVSRSREFKTERRRCLERLTAESLSPWRLSFLSKNPGANAPVVYRLKNARFAYPGTGLIVGVKALKSPGELKKELKPFWSHLQCIVAGGGRDQKLSLAGLFKTSTVNRICFAGSAQDPPLDWNL